MPLLAFPQDLFYRRSPAPVWQPQIRPCRPVPVLHLRLLVQDLKDSANHLRTLMTMLDFSLYVVTFYPAAISFIMQWLLNRSLFVIKFCSTLWHYIFRLASNLLGSSQSFTRKKRLRQKGSACGIELYYMRAPVFPCVCDYRIHLVVGAISLTLKLLEFLRCDAPVSSTLALSQL